MPAAPASRAAGREVTPVELFRLLPAHFAAVLVCTLLGGILAFAAACLAPRSYQAEAQLYVAAAQEGLTSGYAELQLTADYQELLTSRTMLESVISTLGLSTDTAHLKDQITILHPADTHILRIVATDSSPQRAADIANALAALALDDLSARMGTTPPRLVEQAAPPQRFSGPGAVFHAAFGAGIGFLLCFAFLCLHYLRDDHIYTADDLTRCLGSSPLACIPDATPPPYPERRPPMKELALNHLPELAPRTVESLNLLRLRLEQTAPDAKIILLTSTTPQEGKTTLALQFWQLLAGLGQRCLLVDGDLRHSGICRQCGLTGEHKVPGLAHYLSGSVPLEEVLYHTEIRGTCLVPASGTTSRPALLLEHPRFARMVESCAPKFAYLLVDAPALSECSDALSLAKVCDGALLVVQSGGVTHQELRQAAHLLQGCGLPLLGTVLNRTPY